MHNMSTRSIENLILDEKQTDVGPTADDDDDQHESLSYGLLVAMFFEDGKHYS